jgi:hypothetical protein
MNAFFIQNEMRKERGCHVAAAPVQHRRPWGRRLRFGDGKEKAPRQGGASLTWLGNRPQISGADDSCRSERGRRGLASKKKPRRSGAKSKGTSRSKQATSGLYAVRRVSSNLLLRCKNISSVRRSSRKIAPPKRGGLENSAYGRRCERLTPPDQLSSTASARAGAQVPPKSGGTTVRVRPIPILPDNLMSQHSRRA